MVIKKKLKKKVRRTVLKSRARFPAKKTTPVATCPLYSASMSNTPVIIVVTAQPNQKVVIGAPVTQPKIVVPPDPEFEKISSFFEINGDKNYQERVRSDLWKLYNTPTGKNLLLSIQKSNKKVKINFQSQAAKAEAIDEGLTRDANGKPGKGADEVNVYFDPDINISAGGRKDFKDLPSAIVLGHELIHTQHYVSGTTGTGMVNNNKRWNPSDPFTYVQEKREEVETAGIPPNDQREFTENKLRSEWNPPQVQRQYY